MRKIILSFILMLCIHTLYAQNYPVITVKGEITSNQTWSPGQQYKLEGFVYVTSGVTLTIQPGTIIRGDKDTKGTLIVERGAKIMAEGTKEKPIVFTSNQGQGDRSLGDWGGVIVCGSAPTNWTAGEAQVEGGPRSKYGGTNANDNSGKLSYVRIEFAGIAFSPNNEVNGLTLCGVGAGTEIHHIQVSYSGDDAIEWFGGNVNSKYLVTVGTWDDDFDTDAMYDGKSQFVFALRDPYSADVSGSKSFESDSYLAGTDDGKTDKSKATKGIFSNATVVGPMVSPTSTAFDPQFVAAAHIRRGSALSILNSVFIGYPAGVLIDESSSSYGSTVANAVDNVLQFRNNIIAGIPTNATPASKEIIYVKDGARNLTPTNSPASDSSAWGTLVGPNTWLRASSNSNTIYANAQNGIRLQNPFNLTNPNPVPTSTSPIVYNSRTLPGYVTNNGTTDPFSNGRVYPFNPNKPINTDTSALFVNYNAPSIVPDFTASRASDPFFEKVNYVGAFSGRQTTADNWMQGWTNFDPNNTNYDVVDTKVEEVVSDIQKVAVYPNPASASAFITFGVNNASDVDVMMTDMTGKVVKNLYTGKNIVGGQMLPIDLSDVNAGFYFITVTNGQFKSSAKITVVK
jgi:hypothetical protein